MADVRIHAAVPRFPLLVELEPEQRQVLAPKHPDHAAVRRHTCMHACDKAISMQSVASHQHATKRTGSSFVDLEATL